MLRFAVALTDVQQQFVAFLLVSAGLLNHVPRAARW